ncbi:MAG: VTT domain-containing protein [Oligoflexia bacterium]|nr:VTT domain-containing protein [Oligoflexia bacterium]
MSLDLATLLEWFSTYAYEPWLVYGMIILLLTASSFGLPVPEEVTLVSVGLLAYLAKNPDRFPPPYPGAEPVSLKGLMFIAFMSVVLSDFLVFLIGKYGGKKLKKKKKWAKFFRSKAFRKAEVWVKRYGYLMSGVFRFTPGLRFPGHMICGMMGVPIWAFLAVDGMAALLSVPTQIWLVAQYGEEILAFMKQFKIALFIVIIISLAIFFIRRHFLSKAENS